MTDQHYLKTRSTKSMKTASKAKGTTGTSKVSTKAKGTSKVSTKAKGTSKVSKVKTAPKASKSQTSARSSKHSKKSSSERRNYRGSSRVVYAFTRRIEKMHQHLSDYRPKSIKAMANFLGYDISENDMKKQTRPWMSTPVKSAKLKTAKNK